MTGLELLAPARNAEIGIAAIDCGADAVYIAAPAFGARKDAGNPVSDIARLCEYAHKFGARVFVTFNILIRDDEQDAMRSQMLECQEAGADAFIIRDLRPTAWNDITVPLHASTQCAIRTAGDAVKFESAGCDRIILERELSLETVREIRRAVKCDMEFFVHGALCVCYSGECRLSEKINGRSADRGECIQACRSLYDLEDTDGRTIIRNKALLSLKDLNLRNRLEDLAEAGVMSFKIEGRLKNESYVRNVTRSYSEALDALVRKYPDKYSRTSFGSVSASFTPDLSKTFNRGYTELYLDGKRGNWASMDAPKSMGECVGTVESVRTRPNGTTEIRLDAGRGKAVLRNGDGFAFITGNGIEGFRGDVCEGRTILCKTTSGLRKGTVLFRNISTGFEKSLDTKCRRELNVNLDVSIREDLSIDIDARCEDGRSFRKTFCPGAEAAGNKERAAAILKEGLEKRVDHYSCHVRRFGYSGSLPILPSSAANAIRREMVSGIDRQSPVHGAVRTRPSGEMVFPPKVRPAVREPLMRSRYCIRYELGMCPVHQGAEPSGPLFLVNNGRRFALGFDCRECEMTVSSIPEKSWPSHPRTGR